MNTLRELPGTVTNFISDSANVASSYIPTPDLSFFGVGTSRAIATTTIANATATPEIPSNPHLGDKSLPIPASLVKEQWRLIFTSDANVQDLEAAIAHCQDLVMLSEECSDERRWLVRHLVDLRYSLKELKDAESDPLETGPTVKTVVGHHFVVYQPTRRHSLTQVATTRQYCDHCAGIIWSVVQMAYICSDCRYLAHQKCVDSVVRVCAHVIASERQYPIAEICPEIGLAAQQYKCAECETMLNFKNSWIEPRLCDYNGLYYCPACHWNDSIIIPARVVHNWDFTPRKVSRASLQEVRLFLDMPLIKLEECNPKLFVFLAKLGALKKLRQNLVFMRKYLVECRQSIEEKLLETQIGLHRHLVQSNDFYSINDLEQVESGALAEFLHKVFNAFNLHIRGCALCMAKAYICEICSNNEVIFPFDDGCIICDQCNSIFHRVCLTRKNMICPKCLRLRERRLKHKNVKDTGEDDDDDESGDDNNDEDDGQKSES